MGQPSSIPSNHGTLTRDVAALTATKGPPAVIMRQGKPSIFSRLADFLQGRNGGTSWPASPEGRSSPGDPAIIGLVTTDGDRRLLAGICTRNGWPLLIANTREEVRTALEKLKAPIILCDRDLPGKGWRETVEDLAASPHRACILLLSGVVDTYLWHEVVRTGGYDVLSKPLREDEVVRAVRLAWSYWNSAAKTTALPGK